VPHAARATAQPAATTARISGPLVSNWTGTLQRFRFATSSVLADDA
jgi:hypothetical protein